MNYMEDTLFGLNIESEAIESVALLESPYQALWDHIQDDSAWSSTWNLSSEQKLYLYEIADQMIDQINFGQALNLQQLFTEKGVMTNSAINYTLSVYKAIQLIDSYEEEESFDFKDELFLLLIDRIPGLKSAYQAT